jgi:hypothetical protein
VYARLRGVFLFRGLIAASTVVLGACGSTVATQVAAPGDVACAVSPTAPQQLLASGGDHVDIWMTAARDCLWNVSVAATWLQVSPASGQGRAAVIFTASSNPGSEPRMATVLVNGTPITIVQAGVTTSSGPSSTSTMPAVPTGTGAAPAPPLPTVTCVPSVSPTAVTFAGDGGDGLIRVSIASGCRWTATSTAGWIDITAGASGTGSGAVAFTVAKHKGNGGRSGELVVAGTTVPVTQDGGKD